MPHLLEIDMNDIREKVHCYKEENNGEPPENIILILQEGSSIFGIELKGLDLTNESTDKWIPNNE